jgi:tellurite resistance protein TehA-like permease
LNGSWLLLVVATESVSITSALLASRGGGTAMTFFALAFYLLGALFYVLLSALILFRWLFHPMPPSRMDAPWWINMGAAAIATLAGTQLMDLLAHETRFTAMLPVLASLTVLLWTTSTFWIPLLVILFLWTMIQEGLPGYRPGLWSAVFPLGMYATATFEYAAVAQLSFLQPLPLIFFWAAFLAWLLTFAGMCAQFLRRSPRIA